MCSLRRLQVYIYHIVVLFSCRMTCCICSSPPTSSIKCSSKSRERKWSVNWTAEQQPQSINASASCLHQQMMSERGLFSSGRRMFGGWRSLTDTLFTALKDAFEVWLIPLTPPLLLSHGLANRSHKSASHPVELRWFCVLKCVLSVAGLKQWPGRAC